MLSSEVLVGAVWKWKKKRFQCARANCSGLSDTFRMSGGSLFQWRHRVRSCHTQLPCLFMLITCKQLNQAVTLPHQMCNRTPLIDNTANILITASTDLSVRPKRALVTARYYPYNLIYCSKIISANAGILDNNINTKTPLKTTQTQLSRDS